MPHIVYTVMKTPIYLEDKPLAVPGNEGAVFRVKSPTNFLQSCVKIYHAQKRTITRQQKIDFIIHNKPQITFTANYIICFPTEIVYDNNSKFLGFIMPLGFTGSEKLYEITTVKISNRLIGNWSKFERTSKLGVEKRLKICVNIAIAVHSLHQSGKYAIVDYKPQNILITNDGRISIIDADSFQISNNNIVLYHSEVATPEYTPPEFRKLNPANSFIPLSWDRFSLAVSFYEILFGIHPYAATCGGQYGNRTTIGEKIQKGLFVHGSKKTYLTVIPPLHKDFFNLPESIRNLFIKSFEEGQTNPNARPSAEVWGQTIHEELKINDRIKPNTTTITRKNTTLATPQKMEKNISIPRVSNTNTSQSKAVVLQPAKKEDYMLWKSSTMVFFILAIFFAWLLSVKIKENNSKFQNLEEKASASVSENAKLQNQINQLKNKQLSTDSNYAFQIQGLENMLDTIGQEYPLTLSEISFNNINRSSQVITPRSHNFSKNEFEFIQPVIKYKSNIRSRLNTRISYKVFNPAGGLISGVGSPYDFTWYKDIYIPGDFHQNNNDSLSAYGINCPDCESGRYKVEIWCNRVMIGESYFDINEF